MKQILTPGQKDARRLLFGAQIFITILKDTRNEQKRKTSLPGVWAACGTLLTAVQCFFVKLKDAGLKDVINEMNVDELNDCIGFLDNMYDGDIKVAPDNSEAIAAYNTWLVDNGHIESNLIETYKAATE